jgi:hypothetical protein
MAELVEEQAHLGVSRPPLPGGTARIVEGDVESVVVDVVDGVAVVYPHAGIGQRYMPGGSACPTPVTGFDVAAHPEAGIGAGRGCGRSEKGQRECADERA